MSSPPPSGYEAAGWIEHREKKSAGKRDRDLDRDKGKGGHDTGSSKWSDTDWAPATADGVAGATDDDLFMVGKHCSVCRVLDFLPLPCSTCHSSFCNSHGVAHVCPAGPAATAGRAHRGPGAHAHAASPSTCPPTPSTGCGHSHGDTTAGRSSARTPAKTPAKTQAPTSSVSASASKPPKRRCPVKGCKKSLGLFSIECRACRGLFCPAHRFESDHYCAGRGSPAANSRLLNMAQNSRLVGVVA